MESGKKMETALVLNYTFSCRDNSLLLEFKPRLQPRKDECSYIDHPVLSLDSFSVSLTENSHVCSRHFFRVSAIVAPIKVLVSILTISLGARFNQSMCSLP